MTCEDVTLTYKQFHQLSNRAARGLAAKGVKFGDMVTLGLPNSTDFAGLLGDLETGRDAAAHLLPGLPRRAGGDHGAGQDAGGDRRLRTPDRPTAAERVGTDRPVRRRQGLRFDAIAPVSKAPTSGGSTGRPKLILSGQPGVTSKDILEAAAGG